MSGKKDIEKDKGSGGASPAEVSGAGGKKKVKIKGKKDGGATLSPPSTVEGSGHVVEADRTEIGEPKAPLAEVEGGDCSRSPSMPLPESHLAKEETTLAKAVAVPPGPAGPSGEAMEAWRLKRTDSDMTAYTDLLDEMIGDQAELLTGFRLSDLDGLSDHYEQLVVKRLPVGIQTRREREAKARAAAPKKKRGPAPKSKALKKEQYAAARSISPIREADKEKRIHLFRGKCLNSKPLADISSVSSAGTASASSLPLRRRTGEEIKKTVTVKFRSDRSLCADGVLIDDPSLVVVADKTREYLKSVKDGTRRTSIFNAGERYEKAVKDLITLTGAKGNTVVATSKFSRIASEYISGKMGGAAAGDRAMEYGYDKKKRPVGRCLGVGYAMSITVEEYHRFREDCSLLDANVDVAKGVLCNIMIEEVTFSAYIPGHMVIGSLPMVLPRFDRPYSTMDEAKRSQYLRVFGLDGRLYEEFQRQFAADSVPLAQITEHVVRHHSKLLMKMAINADTKKGYTHKFVVPKSEIAHSPALSNATGAIKGDVLCTRDASKKRIAAPAPKYILPRGGLYHDHIQELAQNLIPPTAMGTTLNHAVVATTAQPAANVLGIVEFLQSTASSPIPTAAIVNVLPGTPQAHWVLYYSVQIGSHTYGAVFNPLGPNTIYDAPIQQMLGDISAFYTTNGMSASNVHLSVHSLNVQGHDNSCGVWALHFLNLINNISLTTHNPSIGTVLDGIQFSHTNIEVLWAQFNSMYSLISIPDVPQAQPPVHTGEFYGSAFQISHTEGELPRDLDLIGSALFQIWDS